MGRGVVSGGAQASPGGRSDPLAGTLGADRALHGSARGRAHGDATARRGLGVLDLMANESALECVGRPDRDHRC